MPAPINLRHGMARPFAVRIQSGTSGIDMNTISDVVFRVRAHGDGWTKDWPAVLSERSISQLTATHLVAAGECPKPGQYSVLPVLTITGQEWPEEAEEFNLTVK